MLRKSDLNKLIFLYLYINYMFYFVLISQTLVIRRKSFMSFHQQNELFLSFLKLG